MVSTGWAKADRVLASPYRRARETARIGLQGAQYSYSTAIGLFNTLVNIALLFIVTRVARKVADYKFI